MLLYNVIVQSVKLSGSYQIGCLYSEDEIQESGKTEVYEFAGGSGFINTVHFV